MLQEKTVQKRALTFLKEYYNNRFIRRKIYAAQEVCTKKKYGGKRADGILAFKNWFFRKPFVVSIEAKSLKTLPAIRPYQDIWRWWRNSFRFGVGLCLASGLLFVYAQEQYGVPWWLPLAFSLLSGLTFGFLTWNSYRHQTIDVITQLKQYPANEQWLAFSKGAFSALTIEKQKLLTTICSGRGIGLLLIGRNAETAILSKPKKRRSWFWETQGGWQWISDYLVYYSREQEIRRAI